MSKLYLIFILTFFITPLVFSDTNNTETITISTYYPAPFGVYNQLRSNELQAEKFAVGDTNGDGKIDSTDQPSRAGDIRLKPQTGDPANWSFGTAGQIAYSSTQDALYINNGSEWVAQGGGGGTYTAWGTDTCASGWTVAYTGYITAQLIEDGLSLNGVYCSSQDLPSGGSGTRRVFQMQGIQGTGYPHATVQRSSCAVCVK